MINRKKGQKGSKWLAAILCLALTAPTALPVAAESTATVTPASGTETDGEAKAENLHTSYYEEAAATDSLKGWPTGPQIEGQAAVVVDLNDGAILYAKNPDTQLYPASITKVLTGMLAVQYLNPTDSHTMTQSEAFGIEVGSSSIWADTDEVFTVEQEIMALMLESANEMALALADQTAGSVKKFVELMNRTARRLGCTGTHFNNPNGLPDPNHFTTAGDMAKIAYAAWKNPAFRKYTTTILYEIPPTNKQVETRYLLNHHKMMKGQAHAYEGVQGGKTGYTVDAGNTLITYAKRGSLNVAVVVLNSVGGAYADTASLLDYAFGNFKRTALEGMTTMDQVSSQPMLPSVENALADQQGLRPIAFRFPAYVTVPKDLDTSKLQRIVIPETNIFGTPSFKNEFYYQGNLIGIARSYLCDAPAE